MFAGVPPPPVHLDSSGLAWAFLKGLLQSVFLFWQVWLLLGTVLAAKLAVRLYARHRLAKSGIGEIDRMGGETFEKYLEALFRRLGYRVERTRYQGDYGADLVVAKDGVRTVVQAKRHQRSVGVKAVQEAVAAKAQYGCTEAMVVTNSHFTGPAATLAKANRVALWDRDRLVQALLTVHGRHDPPPAPVPPAVLSEPDRIQERGGPATCSVCGKAVSAKIEAFCRSQPARFRGRTYCYAHQ